jgi:CubicO group peptidase (beta-lactamase class C family)
MRNNFIFSNRFLSSLALCLFAAQFAVAQAPAAAKQISAKIDEYLKAAVKFDQFSGSVLVARDGKPIFSKGYGMANIELNVPNTPKTVFRIGSLTKQFTSMAIMQLEERGKLSVNDGICKYLENCPAAWQAVTIRHLLTHTSGIPNFTGLPDWDDKLSAQPYTREGFVSLFRDLPLQFAPGEKMKYSNSGYYLLGLIVEKVSDKKYEEFLNENIFVPLGMKNSGSDDSRSILQNRAAGYDWSGNSFVNTRYLNMLNTFSAGSLYSTTEDLLLWDKALSTEKLVSRKSLNEIFTPFKNEYAYGWRIAKRFDRNTTEHSGSINGFSAAILRFPAERVTVIILSNSDRTSATKAGVNLAAIVFGASYKLLEPQLFDILWTTILKKDVESAARQYRELKRAQAGKYDFSEEMLNDLGYDLLRNQKIKEAIEIFKLNVETFPQSANVYDSLGEAYMVNGDKESAIKNYEKSLELNSQNPNAVERLKKLRGNK